MAKVVLTVPDISCSHCERTVRAALQPQPGVRSVQVDVAAKKVQLEYDDTKLDLDRVKAVLEEEGYPVASATAA
jgi:copper chaperone